MLFWKIIYLEESLLPTKILKFVFNDGPVFILKTSWKMFLLKRGEYVTSSVSYTLGSNCLMQDWLQEYVTHSHTPSASWHLGFSYTHISAAIGDRRGLIVLQLPNITFISNKSFLRGKKPLNFVHSYKGGNI